MRDPGRVAGAQETALHPMAWPLKISAPHVPSSKQKKLSLENSNFIGERHTFECKHRKLSIRGCACNDRT